MNRLMERNAIRLTWYTRMGLVSLLVCRRKFPANLTTHRRRLRHEKFKFQTHNRALWSERRICPLGEEIPLVRGDRA
jgi:hypothetical protein